MAEIKTIADVVTALEGIVRHCAQTGHRAGYFAALYGRMTSAVADGIRHNQFEDGPRMERLDITFAKRYLNAWDAYQKPAVCTDAWQGAFDGCANRSLTVIQHLLLGINTHINLDLAIAAAEVAPGEAIHKMESDFHRINDAIASLLDDVQQCLEEVWFPMRWLKRIAAGREEAVLNFSIGAARKTAWANAVALAYLPKDQKAIHLRTMDGMATKIGTGIVKPGVWASSILRMIRLTEYEDVARTIRLIDTTVVP